MVLGDDTHARDLTGAFKPKDQPHSSNLVHGIAAEPSKIISTENLMERVEFAQSQRNNSTTAIFRNQILHGAGDLPHSGLGSTPNERPSAYAPAQPTHQASILGTTGRLHATPGNSYPLSSGTNARSPPIADASGKSDILQSRKLI